MNTLFILSHCVDKQFFFFQSFNQKSKKTYSLVIKNKVAYIQMSDLLISYDFYDIVHFICK